MRRYVSKCLCLSVAGSFKEATKEMMVVAWWCGGNGGVGQLVVVSSQVVLPPSVSHARHI